MMSILNPYLLPSGKYGLISRRGTEIPFNVIDSMEVKIIKSGSAVIKVLDNKGESFYVNEVSNFAQEGISKESVKASLSKRICEIQSAMNVHCDFVKSQKSSKPSPVTTSASTIKPSSVKPVYAKSSLVENPVSESKQPDYCAIISTLESTVKHLCADRETLRKHISYLEKTNKELTAIPIPEPKSSHVFVEKRKPVSNNYNIVGNVDDYLI